MQPPDRSLRPAAVDLRDVEVIAPNLKRRLSGVTSTIVQLIPLQAKKLGVATLGPGLPDDLPKLRWWQLAGLWKPPIRRSFRIWHARRNTEMLAGLVLKRLLRARLKIVFTSAAQRYHTRYTKWLIRQMDAVVATSARSGSFLEVPHRVIMHGVDLERFHPPATKDDKWKASGFPGAFGIGCFGRVRPQKGTDLFVRAMIALLPHYPDWTAVISGRVTSEHRVFRDELAAEIAAAGLKDRIVFLGEVPDVRPWFRRISLCVAPSRNEGFGLTPLEAMASQCAVVASRAGAYEEMILPEETGAVVDVGDGAALEKAIEGYFRNPDRAAAHGLAGRAHVEKRFSAEGEAKALQSLYEELWR